MSSAVAANPLALHDFSAKQDMSPTQLEPARYTLRKKLRAHLPDRPQVWLGGDRRLNCAVAIKRFDISQPGQQIEHQRALALFSTGLPHVPHLIDVFHDTATDTRCVVREYIAGEKLSHLVGKLNLKQNLEHSIALAHLIHDLHSFRPSGLAVGKVKLRDFIVAEDGGIWLYDCPNPKPITFESAGDSVRADVHRAALLALQLIFGIDVLDQTDIERRLRLLPKSVADVLRQASSPDPDIRFASAQWYGNALKAAALEVGDQITKWNECNASSEPPLAPPVFRPLVLSESAAAYSLTTNLADKEWPSLKWSMLAHDALTIREQQSDPSRLSSLSTIDCVHYAHQQDAALQVLTRPEMAAGAILADEVGLGKTIEALMICQEMRARGLADSIMIVAPPAGTTQWLMEARRRIRRNANERGFRLYQRIEDASYPLLIVSSATLRQSARLMSLIESRKDDLLVVDEAHQCCGMPGDSQGLSTLGRAIAHIKRKRTLLLTATPLGNRLRDVVTLSDMIRPGIVGTKDQIVNAITLARGGDKSKAVDAVRILRTRLSAVMIRHRRIDHPGLEIPSVNCEALRVPSRGKSDIDTKIEAAIELATQRMSNERVVIFARSAELRNRLTDRLMIIAPERRVISFQANRRHARALESLFNEHSDAIIIANDVVAEGMNWQAARCMIHLDMPSSPLAWEQRTGRIYRLGQLASSLDVVHLVVTGSNEERILGLYQHDLGLFTLPIGEAASVLDHMRDATLRNLEAPITAILRGTCSDKRFAELSHSLRSARHAYDRHASELNSLDALLFGGMD